MSTINSSSFEELLSNYGFTLTCNNYFVCDHISKMGKDLYTWYVQECVCCMGRIWLKGHNKNVFLSWDKRYGCKECMESNLSSLLHGGHYNNIYIFHRKENEIEVTHKIIDYECREINPDEKLYDSYDESNNDKYDYIGYYD